LSLLQVAQLIEMQKILCPDKNIAIAVGVAAEHHPAAEHAIAGAQPEARYLRATLCCLEARPHDRTGAKPQRICMRIPEYPLDVDTWIISLEKPQNRVASIFDRPQVACQSAPAANDRKDRDAVLELAAATRSPVDRLARSEVAPGRHARDYTAPAAIGLKDLPEPFQVARPPLCRAFGDEIARRDGDCATRLANVLNPRGAFCGALKPEFELAARSTIDRRIDLGIHGDQKALCGPLRSAFGYFLRNPLVDLVLDPADPVVGDRHRLWKFAGSTFPPEVVAGVRNALYGLQ
jgi:hypothetical protein